MTVVIGLLLACVLLGLATAQPDRRTSVAAALAIAAYLFYAYVLAH